MAVSIDAAELDENTALFVRQCLYIQPDQNLYEDMASEDKNITLYINKGNVIELPYLFANGLFQILGNSHREYPSCSLTFTGKLYSHQVPVAEEAYEQLQRYGTTTLSLYTGFGKTILMTYLMCRLGMVSLVLLPPLKNLPKQWASTLRDNTNASVWIVGEGKPPSALTTIVCLRSRIHHVPQQILDMVGILIIDESHLLCTPTSVAGLLATHPRYIMSASATPIKGDDARKGVMEAICGTHSISRISTKPFQVIKLLTGYAPPVSYKQQYKGRPRLDWDALLKALSFHAGRNACIQHLVESNPDFKILIFTRLYDHATLLFDAIRTIEPSTGLMAGKTKKYCDCRVLIGTLSKTGVGFDAATACDDYQGVPFDLIIITISIKKEELLEQAVGRGFRADCPNIIHLVDDNKTVAKHWNSAARWYRSRNGRIIVKSYSVIGATP